MYCVLYMCHTLVLFCVVHTGGVVVDEEIGFTGSVCVLYWGLLVCVRSSKAASTLYNVVVLLILRSYQHNCSMHCSVHSVQQTIMHTDT